MGVEDDIAQGLEDVERGSGDEDEEGEEEEERPTKKGKVTKEKENAKTKQGETKKTGKGKKERKVVEIPRDGTFFPHPIQIPSTIISSNHTLPPLTQLPHPQVSAVASVTGIVPSIGGAKNASSTEGVKVESRSSRISKKLFECVACLFHSCFALSLSLVLRYSMVF